MKKSFYFISILTCIIISSFCYGNRTIEVGKKVPDWLLEGEEKDYRMTSWPNKLVIFNYIDPRCKDQNIRVVGALRDAIVNGKLSINIWQAVLVVNCDTVWYPRFIIRNRAKEKLTEAPELKALLLYDYHGDIDKKWTHRDTKNSSCLMIIDKDGVCRAIHRGAMSKNQVEAFISLAAEIQKEPENYSLLGDIKDGKS